MATNVDLPGFKPIGYKDDTAAIMIHDCQEARGILTGVSQIDGIDIALPDGLHIDRLIGQPISILFLDGEYHIGPGALPEPTHVEVERFAKGIA